MRKLRHSLAYGVTLSPTARGIGQVNLRVCALLDCHWEGTFQKTEILRPLGWGRECWPGSQTPGLRLRVCQRQAMWCPVSHTHLQCLHLPNGVTLRDDPWRCLPLPRGRVLRGPLPRDGWCRPGRSDAGKETTLHLSFHFHTARACLDVFLVHHSADPFHFAECAVLPAVPMTSLEGGVCLPLPLEFPSSLCGTWSTLRKDVARVTVYLMVWDGCHMLRCHPRWRIILNHRIRQISHWLRGWSQSSCQRQVHGV